MALKRLRKIVIDGRTYLWNFSAEYDSMYEEYTAYLTNHRLSPLHIRFDSKPWGGPQIPLEGGQEVVKGDPGTVVNLHHPKWAATLIRQGLERGWKPDQQSQEFIIQNGVELLQALHYTPTG